MRTLLGSLFVVSEDYNGVMILNNAVALTETQNPDVFLVDSNVQDADVLDAKAR